MVNKIVKAKRDCPLVGLAALLPPFSPRVIIAIYQFFLLHINVVLLAVRGSQYFLNTFSTNKPRTYRFLLSQPTNILRTNFSNEFYTRY